MSQLVIEKIMKHHVTVILTFFYLTKAITFNNYHFECRQKFIRWPSRAEVQKVMVDFQAKKGMKGVLVP